MRMLGIAESLKSVTNEMTSGTNIKLINFMHAQNVNLTHEDLNTSIDKPESWWNIHLAFSDTLTSRVK